MAKITIPAVAGGFSLPTDVNTRLQQVEDELNNKVLYRDNVLGEDNSMSNDIDMDGYSLLNYGGSVTTLSSEGLFVSTYQALRDYTGTGNTLYTKSTNTLGDGGEAFFQKITGASPGTYVDDNRLTVVPTGGDGSVGWVRAASKVLDFPTLAAAVNSVQIKAGDVVDLAERETGHQGGAKWDVVLASTVTPNTFNIVVCTGVPTLAVVLRVNENMFNIRRWGGKADGTDNSPVIEAILANYPNGIMLLHGGTFTVTRAIQLVRGWTLKGVSRKDVILRTDTTAEILEGISTTCIVYIKDTWVEVTTITLSGGDTDNPIDGIVFSHVNTPSHLNFTSVDIVLLRQAFVETLGLFMTTFRDVNVASCQRGFIFDSLNGKTSLTFTSCYTSSTKFQPWEFAKVLYSSLHNCGSDADNASDRATEKGVYHFFICDMTLNACGTEHSWGNGMVTVVSSSISIIQPTSLAGRSEFVPDYATYPEYAVGPIQTGTTGCVVNYSGGDMFDWQNTEVNTNYPTKPVADLIAYNYDEVIGGAKDYIMVTVHGQSDAAGDKFTGVGNHFKYCSSLGEAVEVVKSNFNIKSTTRKIIGTGTKINIPIAQQTGANRKHLIKLTGIDGLFNGVLANEFEGKVSFAALNAGPLALTSWGLQGVTSVTAVGDDIVFTLTAAVTNPIVYFDLTSENTLLVDLDGATIT